MQSSRAPSQRKKESSSKWDLVFSKESMRFRLQCAKSYQRPNDAILRLNMKDMQKFGTTVNMRQIGWWTDHSYMCPICDRWLNGLCFKHPLIFVKEKVPPTMPYSVFDTFPPFFYLADSTIRKAGKGVFTKLDLPSGLAFGPYTGVINVGQNAECSGYSWQIFSSNDMQNHIWVDAVDFKYSNWMRYANTARYYQEQNMVGYQYDQYMYYYTFRPIKAHSEIMVWYGSDYGMSLNIPKADKTYGYKAPIKKVAQ